MFNCVPCLLNMYSSRKVTSVLSTFRHLQTGRWSQCCRTLCSAPTLTSMVSDFVLWTSSLCQHYQTLCYGPAVDVSAMSLCAMDLQLASALPDFVLQTCSWYQHYQTSCPELALASTLMIFMLRICSWCQCYQPLCKGLSADIKALRLCGMDPLQYYL